MIVNALSSTLNSSCKVSLVKSTNNSYTSGADTPFNSKASDIISKIYALELSLVIKYSPVSL